MKAYRLNIVNHCEQVHMEFFHRIIFNCARKTYFEGIISDCSKTSGTYRKQSEND